MRKVDNEHYILSTIIVKIVPKHAADQSTEHKPAMINVAYTYKH